MPIVLSFKRSAFSFMASRATCFSSWSMVLFRNLHLRASFPPPEALAPWRVLRAVDSCPPGRLLLYDAGKAVDSKPCVGENGIGQFRGPIGDDGREVLDVIAGIRLQAVELLGFDE